MNHLTLLIKPVSGLCQLRCEYCFYEDISNKRKRKNLGILTEELSRRLLLEAFHSLDAPGELTIFFQGGEPTLAGLDFFRQFLALERKYAPPGITLHHGIQTNGVLLDREWAAFFRENHFLVGLSLDGTQPLHDALRRDAAGVGTWEKSLSVLHLLEDFGVETSILCVVTRQSAKKARQIYRTLTSFGDYALQFIPCLDPLGEKRGAMSHSLLPGDYAAFLCRLFDCWYRDWQGGRYVSIRGFEDYLRHLMHLPPVSCGASGSCGHYLVVEGDGSLYSCDFYVVDRWYLGNIQDTTLAEALHCENARAFLAEGRSPAQCAACPYGLICRGGCKRDREGNRNYYCDAYRAFFDYSLPRLKEMAGGMRPTAYGTSGRPGG